MSRLVRSFATAALNRQESDLALDAPLPLWLVAHREARPLRRIDGAWRVLVEIAHGLAEDGLDPPS